MFLYCLNTSTIRNCDLGLKEKIELTAKTGYTGIEIWVSEIHEYIGRGGSIKELRSILSDNGLELPNLIAFFQWANPDKAKRTKEMREGEIILSAAEDLGCPFVAAPPSGITEMVDLPLEDIAQYYADLIKLARKYGVEPLLEFWGHSKKLGSLKEAMRVLELVNDPDAKMLGDVFHMAKTKGSFELMKQLKPGQLGLFHVNDYPDAPDITKLTDDQRVYPGDGAAPLKEIAQTLKNLNYSGFLSLELFNEEYEKAGAETVLKTGLEKTK
ncbi:TIM barrel protein, partial [Candidatus Poribacteria bacterium]|nr:TIM barrel protein [Candidatus Poribacteria bacterium]